VLLRLLLMRLPFAAYRVESVTQPLVGSTKRHAAVTRHIPVAIVIICRPQSTQHRVAMAATRLAAYM